MAFKMNYKDGVVLRSLAEYRVLTPTQITPFYRKSRQVVWRRLRILEKEGLVRTIKYELGRGRGRPESLLGLTKYGVEVLVEKKLIDKGIPYESILTDKSFCTDHQLLLNWFRIYLSHIESVLPRITVKFLAYNSPFLPKSAEGRPLITDYSPVPDSGELGVKFTPDGVFGTCDSIEKKTCLFFLEVDCGTETLASPKRNMNDLRQKIINYQWYFDSNGYKRYEDVFRSKLRGFRLLFLTSTYGRLAALCKLTQEMSPTNFVWLTECGHLFAEGVSAKIWVIGGELSRPSDSILGSLCCSAPLP
jgi:DNA-binding PadR family transcriptional regulator